MVEPHWITQLPSNIEQFNKKFSRKRRKEWRRLEKKLIQSAGGEVEIQCYSKEDDIDSFIKIACEISSSTYKEVMGVGFRDTGLTRSLIRQSAQGGCWRAYVLFANNMPCAFLSGTIYEDVCFFEAFGYHPKWRKYSPGTLLLLHTLRDMTKEGAVGIVDYGFGDASYKLRFGTQCWQEASVKIFAVRAYPMFMNIARIMILAFSLFLSTVVARLGVYHFIKKLWRNNLQHKGYVARGDFER